MAEQLSQGYDLVERVLLQWFSEVHLISVSKETYGLNRGMMDTTTPAFLRPLRMILYLPSLSKFDTVFD